MPRTAVRATGTPGLPGPPYSLEVQNYPAYNTLRSVLMEETLHMAAACNLLAAVGGAPRIRPLDPTAIRGSRPGTVAPGLTARFARLSRRQLDTFMRIEAPEGLPRPGQRQGRYPTIGSFYREIKDAVVANADTVTASVRGRHVAHQVGGNLGYAVIDPCGPDPVEQILAGLDLIMSRDEGFGQSTLSSGASSQDQLSHYARFAELNFGRTYTGPDADDADIDVEGQRRYFRIPDAAVSRIDELYPSEAVHLRALSDVAAPLLRAAVPQPHPAPRRVATLRLAR